jgi:hypothetical protein
MSGISQAVALRPDRDRVFKRSQRTCDVLVQYCVFFDHIVDQAPRCVVEYQHFPLKIMVRFERSGEGGRRYERTSPWVTCRIVVKMTAYMLVLSDLNNVFVRLTLSLGL